jgi:hypothetical protein
MQPFGVITGTLTDRLTGNVTDVAFYLPLDSLQVVAMVCGYLFVLLLWCASNKFQMWALMIALICAIIVSSLALTFVAPYVVAFSAVPLVLVSFLKAVQAATKFSFGKGGAR